MSNYKKKKRNNTKVKSNNSRKNTENKKKKKPQNIKVMMKMMNTTKIPRNPKESKKINEPQ